jgi:RND superfamily putative drug exporter
VFARLGRTVVHHPWRVIAVWVVVAVGLVVFAPRLGDITETDQTAFLPDTYESAQAQTIADQAFPQTTGLTALVVVKRQDDAVLTAADQDRVAKVAAGLTAAKVDGIASVSTSAQSVSENEQVQLINVSMEGSAQDPAALEAVKPLREALAKQLEGSDLKAGVTGDAAIGYDTNEKFLRAEQVVGIATIGLIIVLMLLMFRSPIAALLPVITVALVSVVAQSVIGLTGKTFGFEIGQEVPILLTVVLYGIGTDYILFLLFRYRERLRRGDESKDAVVTAVHRVGEAIASAAGAVIVAFSALALSSFASFKTMGPSLAIAVACMLVAALTLIPAVVSLVGPRVFWPSKSHRKTPRGSLFAWVGGVVAARPLAVAVGSVVLLGAMAAGAVNVKQSYESVGSPEPGTSAATWFDEMRTGFPPGVTAPTTIYVRSTNGSALDTSGLATYTDALAKVDGVGQVQPLGADDAGEPVKWALSKDGKVAQVNLLLDDNPFSAAAMDDVKNQIRDAAHASAPAGTEAKVGGLTSAFVDVQTVTTRDLRLIFPVAGVLILLILMALLRAAVAPLYLMLAVALGYAATLGATTWAFQTIGGEPGLMFILPIFVYLFVVAIGTDYNILMIARLREEAQLGLAPRPAADMAVEHAGPSVASAGIILAGTFCALMLSGVTFLTQIGFAVAVGIMFAAFVMAMLLVPALTALVGRRAWWPGHGDAPQPGAGEGVPAEELEPVH